MPRNASSFSEVVLTLAGTQEYVAWIDGIATDTSRTKSAIVRIALAEWAERNGHAAPPKLQRKGA